MHVSNHLVIQNLSFSFYISNPFFNSIVKLGRIECPLCKSVHRFSLFKGIDSLPKNRYVANVVEKLQTVPEPSTTSEPSNPPNSSSNPSVEIPFPYNIYLQNFQPPAPSAPPLELEEQVKPNAPVEPSNSLYPSIPVPSQPPLNQKPISPSSSQQTLIPPPLPAKPNQQTTNFYVNNSSSESPIKYQNVTPTNPSTFASPSISSSYIDDSQNQSDNRPAPKKQKTEASENRKSGFFGVKKKVFLSLIF